MRLKFFVSVTCVSTFLTLCSVALPTGLTVGVPVGVAQGIPGTAVSNSIAEKQKIDQRILEIIDKTNIVIGQANSDLDRMAPMIRNDQGGKEKIELARQVLKYREFGQKFPLMLNLRNLPPVFEKRLKLLDAMTMMDRGDYLTAVHQLNLVRGELWHDADANKSRRLSMAHGFRQMGEYQAALREVGDLNVDINPVVAAEATGIKADIALDLGQYGKARDLYEAALSRRRSIPIFYGYRNLNKITEHQINLGRTYRLLRQPAEAQKYYEAAQQRVERSDDPQGRVFLLTQLGLTALENGQFDLAQRQLLEAVERSQGYTASYRVRALEALGRYYQTREQWEQAIQTYNQALELGQRKREIPGQARVLTNLGEIHVQNQQWDKAIEVLTQAINLYESVLRNDLNSQDKISISEIQAYAYQLLQKAQIEKGQIQLSLVTAERGRARTFVDELIQRGLNRAITAQESNNVSVSLSKRQTQIQQKVRDSKLTKTPTIEAMQNTAREQRSTIVSYSILRNPETRIETDLYIWVVPPQGEIQFRRVDLQQLEGQSFKKIITTSRIASATGTEISQQVVSNLVVAMRSGSRGANRSSSKMQPSETEKNAPNISTASRNAYELLIQPIAQLLPKNPDDRVVFIPQGSLHLVPFQALQDSSGKYLIEQHTIQVAPSIQALQLVSQRKSMTGKPMIVGNPNPMPEDLSPLPGAEVEAKNIAQLLKTEAVVGGKATESLVRNQIRSANLLHFATHGLVDDERGLGSAIALVEDREEDGLLTAGEIIMLDLNADLAVLSACDTGRGKITGDGVIGLARSLMSAGVPSVVVSLWAVPDVPTKALMTDFYRNLQQEPDKAKALRKAMLNTMKDYPNPSDWAGFMLVGRAD